MIRCIALDDEPLALEVLEEFCSRIDSIELLKTFTQPSEALKFLDNTLVDLIFLDIQMPEISGIDFYKSISQNTMVIFTTAYTEYAVEGFNLSAVDYLLKPFEYKRFLQATEKATDYYNYLNQSLYKNSQNLYVRSEYSLIKIPCEEIQYIETLDDYIKIHCPGKKPILTLMTMKSVMDKLPVNEFVRVHRSFIVPLKRIESVRGKIIELGVAQIPIGTKYEEAFFKAYTAEHFY